MRFYEEEWQRLAARCALAGCAVTFSIPEPGEKDFFRIRSDARQCRIAGSNERSLLLGVYRYFYELGVRFLGPGRRYEWFPDAIDPRTLEQDLMIRAGYDHRGVCIEGADSLENILDMIDWLPKIGMNSFFLQFREPDTFLRRWYAHTGNPSLPVEAFDGPSMSRQITEALQKRDLLHHRVGHGWTGAVLGTQAEGWDPETAHATPEQQALCAEVQGVRDFFGGVPLNTNLCMSNPEVQERFVREVIFYAKAHPEVHRLHVWLADDCNNHCECAACRSLTPTDHYIRLLNRIDEALTAAGLKTKIVFLLYLELLWAPIHEKLANPERFILMFAPISRRFETGYRDVSRIPETPAFSLNRITLPTRVEENLAFLQDWQRTYAGDSFDYDYHLGRAHFGDLGYMQIARRLNEDIYALRRFGLNGMIACQELRAGFPHWLPDYTMGMTLAEPAFSFGDLEDDYFMHAYGPYAQEVMRYLEKLSALVSPDWFNGKGPRVREDLVPRYSEALALVRSMQPQIRTMQDSHPVTQRFLAILRYHAEYAEAFLTVCLAKLKGQEPDAAAFKELIRQRESDFQECLDVYRIQEVMRNYTGIE